MSRRRSKGGKGAPEQGILDELTNPPIAFNILSVIILLGASAMVTDATGKQVKKKGVNQQLPRTNEWSLLKGRQQELRRRRGLSR